MRNSLSETRCKGGLHTVRALQTWASMPKYVDTYERTLYNEKEMRWHKKVKH